MAVFAYKGESREEYWDFIDRTLERSAPMLATLRDAIALLPPLVAELEGHSGVAQGVEAMSARANVHAAGQAIAVPASREAAAAGQEPTQILARLDDEFDNPTPFEQLLRDAGGDSVR